MRTITCIWTFVRRLCRSIDQPRQEHIQCSFQVRYDRSRLLGKQKKKMINDVIWHDPTTCCRRLSHASFVVVDRPSWKMMWDEMLFVCGSHEWGLRMIGYVCMYMPYLPPELGRCMHKWSAAISRQKNACHLPALETRDREMYHVRASIVGLAGIPHIQWRSQDWRKPLAQKNLPQGKILTSIRLLTTSKNIPYKIWFNCTKILEFKLNA